MDERQAAMSASRPAAVHGVAVTPADVLGELAGGVLTVGADGVVTYANRSAGAFFPSPNPVGIQLLTFLELAGVSNGGDLVAATQSPTESGAIRIGLSDGRILDARARKLADGGTVVMLLDVSRYIRDAELAHRDPLTGLSNRADLRRRLGMLLATFQRTRTPFAVISLDLDRFKSVNDTVGHPMGDLLLVKVAERLRATLRPSDIAARTGGDEFVILQSSGEQPQAAAALAMRLVDLIGRTYVVSGQILNIGASVGIALSPADGTDIDSLLKHADLALYRAKTEGKGAFRFFQVGMDEDMQARRLLELALRNALVFKEFELRYQPQVDLRSRELVGFEALLRWHRPSTGLVLPAEFVPLAEQIGLIVPIGEWALQTACRQAASWSKPVSIGVNVSAVQFNDARLVQVVTSALRASGLDARRLELEITESVLINSTKSVLEQLYGVKALGVRVAMDDFGTGYSSLTYLRKFPFDRIKIDQRFVRGSVDGADGRIIVRAVTALGGSLGIKTIAEGVETEEQLAEVQAEGCTEVQGYLTSQPLDAEAAAALVTQSRSDATIPGGHP
jgi:diguanylate cyclase (GGDEF)-like protein